MSKQITSDDIKTSLRKAVRFLNKYRGLIFFVILATIYGFIIWRINVLSTAPPTEADTKNAQASASAGPSIDEKTVQAINSLKDNSVRVQAIFDDARNNPFDE